MYTAGSIQLKSTKQVSTVGCDQIKSYIEHSTLNLTPSINPHVISLLTKTQFIIVHHDQEWHAGHWDLIGIKLLIFDFHPMKLINS